MGVGTYLGFHVIEGWRADDRETDQEDVGLRVGEGSEAVVIFLSGGIPQSEADRPAVDHHAGRVVVEAVDRGVSCDSSSRRVHRNVRRGGGRPTRWGCTRPGRRSLCTRSKDMSGELESILWSVVSRDPREVGC